MNPANPDSKPPVAGLTVVQVVPRLHVGGVERGTIEFANHLLQNGHRPVVISAGGQMVEQLNLAGIEHIQMDVASKSVMMFFKSAKLRQILEQLKPDVVHARSRVPAWMCHLAIRKMTHKPLFITTLHGLHSVNRYSAIMASSDQVIAVSETARSYLQENYQRHLKADPVVIYRGISEAFNPIHKIPAEWLRQWQRKHPHIQSCRKVLLPGRLTRLKGLENLLPWLQQAPADVVLLLTAEPEDSGYAGEMIRRLEQLQLTERVCWLGVERDMPSLYQCVDLVVSVNNKPESFGRTVLEALSMGVPVVGFAMGGVQEVMAQLFPEGLVPAGNISALTDSINQLLDQPSEVKSHSPFSNQRMFTETVSLYHQLLEQRCE